MAKSDTQFGGPRANPQVKGRPPGIVLGKRRARLLRKARLEERAAIGGELPEPERDHIHPKTFFQSLLDNETLPAETRGAAARSLAQFWPEEPEPPPASDIDWAAVGEGMSPEELDEVVAALKLIASIRASQCGQSADAVGGSAPPSLRAVRQRKAASRVAALPAAEAKADDGGAAPPDEPAPTAGTDR